MVCVNDKCKICDDCYLFGEHKGHFIKRKDQINQEAQEKSQEMKDMIHKVTEEKNEMFDLLHKKEESLQKSIKERFQEVQLGLESQYFELSSKISGYFEEVKQKVTKTFQEDSDWRKEIEFKAQAMEDLWSSQLLFSLLDEQTRPSVTQLRDFIGHDLSLQEIKKIIQDIPSKVDPAPLKQYQDLPQIDQLNYEILKTIVFDELSFEKLVQDKEKDILEIISHIDIRKEGPVLYLQVSPKDPSNIIITALDLCEITQLELILEDCPKLTEDIKVLYYLYQYLEDIKTLSISFKNPNIPNKTLEKLLSVIFCKPYSPGIQEVQINFAACFVDNSILGPLFTSYLPQMPNITTLSLVLDFTPITNETLTCFALSCIPKLKGLRSLTISLAYTEISDLGAKTLMSRIGMIVQRSEKLTIKGGDMIIEKEGEGRRGLRVLNMNLKGTKITDDVLKDVGNPFEGLEMLFVDLGETEISNIGVNRLMKLALCGKGMEISLKTLGVNLGGSNVTEEKRNQMQAIAEEIWEMNMKEMNKMKN